MPLKLSLKPGEAVIINGAVLRNGARRGTILLENQARVLREKDVMQPEDIETPGERVYFSVMQMYLTGDGDGLIYDQITMALGGMLNSAISSSWRTQILDISRACAAGETYRALNICRKLVKQERLERECQNG